MRLAIIQPPIWGNLRTPWEVAYVKSYVEAQGPYEARAIDMGPATLPLVEMFARDIRTVVDDSFGTECYINSLAFLTSISEVYLIRLFYDPDEPGYREAIRALLASKTHHREDALERLTDMFSTHPFFVWLDEELRETAWRVVDDGFDCVGCTTHITSYPIALFLLREVKRRRPKVLTILSGYQASMTSEDTLAACPWVDIVIRGESEAGYHQVLVEGAGSRRVLDVSTAALPIDEMPPPDYRDLDLGRYRLVSIMASRNCPHGKCGFCQEDAFWGHFRFRKAKNIVEDLEVQHARHGVRRFDFVDLDMRDFVIDFNRCLVERGHDFEWSGAMRADVNTPAFLRALGPTRCRSLFFGFESGSSRLLQLMRKNITPATLERTLAAAAETGIRAKLTCITGLPTESDDDFKMTLDFVSRNHRQIRLVLVQCFKLLRRSPIGGVLGVRGNPYGLTPAPVPALDRIEPLLSWAAYDGMPPPGVAIERFIAARAVFRELGVDEHATLASGNLRHQPHLLSLR